MAKELPYLKFEPSEWLEGEIQICSDAAIVCFTNLMSGYWLKLGCISYAFALHKYCRKDESIIKELIDDGIISINDDGIVIKFLDELLDEFQKTSEKRRKAANKRWNNASALQVDSKSNTIREDKSKEEEIKEDNSIEDIPLEKVTKFSFKNSLLDYGFKKELVEDWLKVRKTKKGVNTKTAFNGFIKKVEERECNINELLTYIIERNWSSFDWDWIDVAKNSVKKESNAERVLKMHDEVLKKLGVSK